MRSCCCQFLFLLLFLFFKLITTLLIANFSECSGNGFAVVFRFITFTYSITSSHHGSIFPSFSGANTPNIEKIKYKSNASGFPSCVFMRNNSVVYSGCISCHNHVAVLNPRKIGKHGPLFYDYKVMRIELRRQPP